MKVAVVGGGAAGAAAAWSLLRAGAEVALFRDRVGATELFPGSLDLGAWWHDEGARGASSGSGRALDPDALAFATALGWTVGGKHAVATSAGIVREVRGLDPALLDLEPLAGRVVAVAETGVHGWDAALLARSLGESPWALRTATRFVAARVEGLVLPEERALPTYEIAARIGGEAPSGALERATAAAAALRDAARAQTSPPDAWLVGPWLSVEPLMAEAIADTAGMPVGETTSPPGGPAGARFSRARDVLLGGEGVSLRAARVSAVRYEDTRWIVVTDSEQPPEPVGFDALVLAIGGIAGGGIELAPAGSGSPLRASLEAPLRFALGGEVLASPSTSRGLDVATVGFSAIENGGIAVDGARVLGAHRLFAAGDCVVGRPRTVLEAVESGIRAASAAVDALRGAGIT